MKPEIRPIEQLIENRYRILEPIETIGMGVLYRVADETRNNQTRALKIIRLPENAESSGLAERFNKTLKSLSQLRHLNLVAYLDYGITTEGDLYYVTEWIDGPILEAKYPGLSLSQSLPMIVELCRALNYLHSNGLVHGNIKPSNVLLLGGRVKVADYGIAPDLNLPQTVSLYRVPHDESIADRRADIYSLGAVWRAVLTGQAPSSSAGDAEAIRKEIEDALAERAESSPEIAALIAGMMSLSSNDRPKDMREVVSSINQITNSDYSLDVAEGSLNAEFIHRNAEFKALENIWRRRESSLVLVGGESGIGKTRLMEELAIKARVDGAQVVLGRCVSAGESPFHPWREILRVLIRDLEIYDPRNFLPLTSTLVELLPELYRKDYFRTLPTIESLEPRASQQRLINSLLRVLYLTAQLRPTLILIEDAHWADEATINVFAALGRVGARLMTCAAYQTDNLPKDHPIERLEGKHITRINVSAFTEETSSRLAASMLGMDSIPPLLSQRIDETTEGNPFFTQEVIRELAENGIVIQRDQASWKIDHSALQGAELPESVHQTIRRRLDQVPEKARTIFQSASIVGLSFWDGILETLAQAERGEVRAALQQGIELGFLYRQQRSALPLQHEFAFVNPAVLEVLYESVPDRQRKQAHYETAKWLTINSPHREDEHLGLIATHYARAEENELAVEYLVRAGGQAAAQFVNDRAIDYFSRALELSARENLRQRYDILSAREKVFDVLGNRDRQKLDIDELARLADEMKDDALILDVALRQTTYSIVTCDYPFAIATAQRVIELATKAMDQNKIAQGHLDWGRTLWFQGKFEAAREKLEYALGIASEGSNVRSDILRNLGNVWDDLGDHAKAIQRYQETLQICRELGDQRSEGMVLNNIGAAYAEQGDLDQAAVYFQQSSQLCEAIGDPWGKASAHTNLGNIAEDQGYYAKADGHYQNALALFQEVNDTWSVSYVFARLGFLSCLTGNSERATTFGRLALQSAQNLGVRPLEGEALLALGHAAMGFNKAEEAAPLYDQSVAIHSELGQIPLLIDALAGSASAEFSLGNLGKAMKRVEELLEHKKSQSWVNRRVYLALYQVLNANGDSRAQAYLDEGYNLLMQSAAKIADEKERKSFLEDNSVNREIADEYRKVNARSSK